MKGFIYKLKWWPLFVTREKAVLQKLGKGKQRLLVIVKFGNHF